ncbi:MAG TPA: hypothetical protein VNR89_01640 [Roseomonas sp.]|nr:hypothetical protein [Roseomonas sp.]
MKAQISRRSHRPEMRYSGAYAIQGGMVTDADLGEGADLAKAQVETLGGDTVRNGVPAEGGAVGIEGGLPVLREGRIYAGGLAGRLVAAPGAAPAGPLDLLTMQADLPLAPALPAGQELVVFADLWERPVFFLEDGYLADPGLHGAETSFRTRTMVQIKAAPLAAADEIEAGTGAWPRIGTAAASVTPVAPDVVVDECDPCAEVVTVRQEVVNTLFRLEVLDVEGAPDAPTALRIAWSMENAAAIAPATVDPEDFERAGAVYEFFSPITESALGLPPAGAAGRRSAFVDDLQTAPNPPQDHDGTPWRFLRRWDGTARIDLAGGAVTDALGGGALGAAAVAGSKVTVTLPAFSITVETASAALLAGDYWLVELRRFAAEAERVRLVSPRPLGVQHHYCTLFRIGADGARQPLNEAERRKLSFPALSDLPASHVRYDNTCEKLYGGAASVQQALDALCGITAEDIGFDPATCPVLFDGATNVQKALANLCKVNFSVEPILRAMMDWGVLCGILPAFAARDPAAVRLSAGAFLDRAGRFGRIEDTELKLAELPRENVHFENDDQLAAALREKRVCLALALGEGGVVGFHLVEKGSAFGPADPGYEQAVENCVKRTGALKLGDALGAIRPELADRVVLAASNGKTFGGAATLSQAEAQEVSTANKALLEQFRGLGNAAEVAQVEASWAKIEAETADGAIGTALEVRNMQREAQKLGALLETDQQRRIRCACQSWFTPCPPELGEPPYYVPLACLRGVWDGRIYLEEVCGHCGRKQALTPRALRYHLGDALWKHDISEDACCPPPARPDRPPIIWDPVRPFPVPRPPIGPIDPGPLSPFGGVRPNVADLAPNVARGVLAGNGLDITTEIDLGDPAAFDKLRTATSGIDPAARLSSGAVAKPGDKVALLVQDGVARDYVILQRGTGKYLFPTAPAAAPDLTELNTRIEAAQAIKDALGGEVAEVGRVRDGLSADVERLRQEITALTTARTEAVAAVEQTKADIAQVNAQQAAAVEKVAGVRQELAALETQRVKLVEDTRRAQPIGTLFADRPELAERLRGAGISSVGEFADLSPERVNALTNSQVMNAAELDQNRLRATQFIRGQNG